jgi:integrase
MKYSVKPIIRKDQLNKQGECPLYVRYTFNRKSVNIPVEESILLTDWDENVDMPKTSCKRFRQVYDRINNLSDLIHSKVSEFEMIYSRKPECKELKEFLNHKKTKEEKIPTAQGRLIQESFKDFIKLRSKELRPSTITIYNTTLLKWKEFEKSENQKFFVGDINGKLLQDFRLFLIENGKQLSTIGKYVKTIKTYINTYLIDYLNLNVDMTFKKAKVDKEEKNTFEVLTEIELETLKEATFYSRFKVDDKVKWINLSENEKLIGKIFLFMCNTGLAYCDLQKLTYADVHIEDENLTDLNHLENNPLKYVFLKIERTKTIHKAECLIPVVGITIDLLTSQLGLPMDHLGAGNLYLDDQERIQIFTPLLQNIKHSFSYLSPEEKLIFPTIHSVKFNVEIKKLLSKLELNEPVPKVFRGKEKIITYVPKYEMISAHSARRTYITLCLRQGVLPDILMQSTGHKKFDTMRSYHKHDAASVNKEIRKKVRN